VVVSPALEEGQTMHGASSFRSRVQHAALPALNMTLNG